MLIASLVKDLQSLGNLRFMGLTTVVCLDAFACRDPATDESGLQSLRQCWQFGGMALIGC